MITPFFDYDARVVSLLGRIDSPQVDLLADQLLRLETKKEAPITLYVSCSGGGLPDAFKIVDVMGSLGSPVTAVAMGLVQGIGILIFSAATERLILPSSLLSTVGMWTLPTLEADSYSSPGFGGAKFDPREALRHQMKAQICRSFPPHVARFIQAAAQTPQLLNATESIAANLADSIVCDRKFAHPTLPRHVHRAR